MKRKKNPLSPLFSRGRWLSSKDEIYRYIEQFYNQTYNRFSFRKLLSCIDRIIYLTSGATKDVFFISTKTNCKFKNGYLLPKNEYILKISAPGDRLDDRCINLHKKLSGLNLIPKIWIINEEFMVMDYIKGMNVGEFRKFLKGYPHLTNQFNVLRKKIDWLIKTIKQIDSDIDTFEDNFVISLDLQNIYYVDPC